MYNVCVKEIKTISVKIDVDKNQYLSLLSDSSQLFNYYTKWAYKNKTHNKKTCHAQTYQEATKIFPNIKTALIQTIRDTATEAVKQRKFKGNPPAKKLYSGLRLDKRCITLRGNQITLIGKEKRHKGILNVPKVHQKYFDSWNFKMATLTYQKKTQQFWINLVFENTKEIVQQALNSTKEILGVDRGLYHLAVTSDKQFFSAQKVREIRRKYLYVKKTLQQKDTPSAKRKLKSISGKEKRFMKDVNHCITKEIVNNPHYKMFVLEKLTNIRSKRQGKILNKLLSNWAFYQFEQFLKYKAEALGKQVVYIDPHYTSQNCSKCGNIDAKSRNKSQFKCTKCGYFEHADINAAVNIKNKYNIPIALIESIGQGGCQSPECKGKSHLQAQPSLVVG